MRTMNNKEIKTALIEILTETKTNPKKELAHELAVGRQALSEIKSASAGIERTVNNLNSLSEIVKLRQQNAAYKYAITYGLQSDFVEHLQRQYEKALTALELGINTFDNILRSEDLIGTIASKTKQLESTRHKRDKMTIEEAERNITQLQNLKTEIDRVAAIYTKLMSKKIRSEAERQGFEV